jgi:hypothetical protein
VKQKRIKQNCAMKNGGMEGKEVYARDEKRKIFFTW